MDWNYKMKKKDINLFNKAIHKIKDIMVDLKEEREKHDKKIDKLMGEAKEVLDEIYELFDDLYKKNDNEK